MTAESGIMLASAWQAGHAFVLALIAVANGMIAEIERRERK